MSREINVDRVLENWFAEGPTELPDRAVAAIVDQLDELKQRGPVWLPGRKRMNRTFLAIGGVAAAVVILAGAGWYAGLFTNADAPGGQPTSTVVATAAPTLTPVAVSAQSSVRIGPGRYFVDIGEHRYTFTLESQGWQASVSGIDARIRKGAPGSAGFGMLWFWGESPSTHVVYGDACRWSTTGAAPGPGVDDFASAVAAVDGFEVSTVTDASVDEYAGKRVQLTAPEDVSFSGCDQGQFRSWDGRWLQVPGQTDDVRIVDVEGVRHLVFTSYDATTPAEMRNQLDGLVESVEIEPIP